jgi:hypothetical protein
VVNFNFTYQPGTSIQTMIGFEVAGRIWGQVLSDNVTVNIHVASTTELPENVLAGSMPGSFKKNLNNFGKNLIEDATSADDFARALAFQDKKEFEAWFDLYDATKRNRGAYQNARNMQITLANGKAVDLVKADDDKLDAFIVMRDLSDSFVSWSYNFDRQTANDPNSVDFLSVALHEIAHALGFVSGVDKPGMLHSTVTDEEAEKDYLDSLRDRAELTTPLDLSRYSTESGQLIDLSIGGDTYFSMDGGNTRFLNFATGKLVSEGGNGFQASHWDQEHAHTLMKPGLSPGEQAFIASEDLYALDLIGWDLGLDPSLINLADIVGQAKQGLAARIGVTADWLDTNAYEASLLLSQDLMEDVEKMIKDSKLDKYEGRRNSRTGSWQEVMDALWQEGIFDVFDFAAFSPRQNRSRSLRTVVQGTEQADDLLGSGEHEQLVGLAGNDHIQGGSGHDNLRGGAGNDVLVGDRGIDVLYGGDGADTFMLQLTSGVDVVQDFTPGEDQLVLGTSLRRNDLDITQENNHVVISQEAKPLMVLSNTDLNAFR